MDCKSIGEANLDIAGIGVRQPGRGGHTMLRSSQHNTDEHITDIAGFRDSVPDSGNPVDLYVHFYPPY